MDLEELQERLEAHVATVDVADCLQGGEAAELHHTKSILDAESAGLAHLAFAVLVVDSQGTGAVRNGEGDVLQVATTVEVQFCYRCRPNGMITDLRRASQLARRIVRAVSQESRWAAGEVNVEVRTLFRPQFLADTPYAFITTSFLVLHEVGL